ncbi:MAG TPA: hypothetical protein PLE74_01070 [Candidatus Cloacimonadota bacterium]|nr:hypothetical protein [Candidatus Cloacimonadota bacterium]
MGGEVKSLLGHIREDLHDKVKNFRNVENYIANKEFELIFEEYKDKDKIFKWIMEGKIEELKNWLEHNKKLLPLDLWNVETLRKEASSLKIPNYLIMNKGTLITIIKRRRSNA